MTTLAQLREEKPSGKTQLNTGSRTKDNTERRKVRAQAHGDEL